MWWNMLQTSINCHEFAIRLMLGCSLYHRYELCLGSFWIHHWNINVHSSRNHRIKLLEWIAQIHALHHRVYQINHRQEKKAKVIVRSDLPDALGWHIEPIPQGKREIEKRRLYQRPNSNSEPVQQEWQFEPDHNICQAAIRHRHLIINLLLFSI